MYIRLLESIILKELCIPELFRTESVKQGSSFFDRCDWMICDLLVLRQVKDVSEK